MLLHSMPSRRQSCFAFSMISSTVGSDIIKPQNTMQYGRMEMGRAQPGKAVKPPHEDSWPSAPCGHRATAPLHWTANPEWAMGVTTYVLPRARCFGQDPARARAGEARRQARTRDCRSGAYATLTTHARRASHRDGLTGRPALSALPKL
jgi:hypothetical protein